MNEPQPPTPRSVSATLRTAGFRAIGDADEGYDAGWCGGDPGSGAVHVSYHSWRGDGTGAAIDAALAATLEALASMTATLRNKGWAVEPSVPRACLIVKEAGQ